MATIVDTGFELQGERSKIGPLLRDLWAARPLMRTLAKKDFFVRYRRQSFGLLWAVGLPLIQAIVMSIIFSRIVRFQTPVKFVVFAFCGMLPWSFFNVAVATATTSIVDGGNLATKVYFPRAVLPLVVVWSGYHGYLPAVAVLLALAAVFGTHFGFALLLLVPATVLMLALSCAFSLLFAALHVYFRDMKYIVQASILPWFWASGVLFPIESLKSLRRWLELNPAVGMIQLYRASIGAAPAGWHRSVVISVIWVVVLLAASLPLYRRYDRVFVDLM